jgi:hypothetical protein
MPVLDSEDPEGCRFESDSGHQNQDAHRRSSRRQTSSYLIFYSFSLGFPAHC